MFEGRQPNILKYQRQVAKPIRLVYNNFSPLGVSGDSPGAGSEVIIVDEVSFIRVLRGPETWRHEEDHQINIVVESYRVREPLGQLQWSGEARSALHSGTVPQCPTARLSECSGKSPVKELIITEIRRRKTPLL